MSNHLTFPSITFIQAATNFLLLLIWQLSNELLQVKMKKKWCITSAIVALTSSTTNFKFVW
jgi:hypothetical protein